MPPKRRAESQLTSKTSAKALKMEVNEANDDKLLKKLVLEVEQALSTKNDARVLQLSSKFMEMHATLSNVATRLLTYYIKANDQSQVHKLLKHQNLDFKTPAAGSDLLWRAVSNGQMETAEMLVCAGADLSIRKSDRNSTIHKVLKFHDFKDQEKRERLASLMLEYGADVNTVDNSGFSILNRAIQNESVSTAFIEKLLRLGANVRIGNNCILNDIDCAVWYRRDLLLKLIEHQNPDIETRNKRGTIAIETLLLEKKAKNENIIKEILELGVPVNNLDPKNPLGDRGCSLLHSAIRAKKIDVIKLLLEYGANVHEKDNYGYTPLYAAATTFKGFSDASRLLISRGASIKQRNNDGKYPIHGACLNESLRNVHLFLSLGANLAVTDKNDKTPFYYMTTANISLTDAGRLVIKHFALMTTKGIPLIEKDLKKIKAFHDVHMFYNSCLEELELMKSTKVCKDIPYFSLFSDNLNDMLMLVKDADFVEAFKNSCSEYSELFCIYVYNLLILFSIALNKLHILERMEKLLIKTFKGVFPTAVIKKIAYYASLKKMMYSEKRSYLIFHQNTKHNDTHKRRLI